MPQPRKLTAAFFARSVHAVAPDLIVIFEALHDMSHPVDVLRGARELLAADGDLIVVDERTADAFGGIALDNPISVTVDCPEHVGIPFLFERDVALTSTFVAHGEVNR